MTSQKIIITCGKNLAPVLASEVKNLGYPVIAENMYDVTTEGNMADTMLMNLHLRTAHRVLLLIKEGNVKDPEELYNFISTLPWEKYIAPESYFSIRSYVENEHIKDLRYANLKAKDAIVDRMYKIEGTRPDSGPAEDKAVFFVHWRHDNCAVYVDTSGGTIAKHHYRKIPFKAPMLESLAAATILSSHWDKIQPFVNPMCGSGTLAIEAALMAIDKPPGLLRNDFGFMHIKGYDRKKWGEMRKQAHERVKHHDSAQPLKIIASDNDPEAIKAAKNNARHAGVEHLIQFETCDFAETTIPQVPKEDQTEKFPVIFFNPEYGERLGEESQLSGLYTKIGDFLKNNCQGYMGYVFTGNLNLAKKVGLRTSRKIIFYTGKIEARLLEYKLFAGRGK